LDISIIIPTFNRASFLLDSLNSIGRVVSPSEPVEIIIVDNGSSDRTREVWKQVSERFSRHHWRYFFDDMPGLLTGRHRGAKEAKGGILAYLDDDTVLVPTWLESLKEAFSHPDVVALGGPSSPVFESNPPRWLRDFWTEIDDGRQCVWLSLIECGNEMKPIDPLNIFGLNFSIRRKTLKDYGGFHPDCIPKPLQRYQGDGETGLAMKMKTAQSLCLYHPGFAVKHVLPPSRLTPASFQERAFYQGVCDSFTEIRRDRGVSRGSCWFWKDLLRPAKWSLERNAVLRGTSNEGVHHLTGIAYRAGVRFHRSEVRNDPRLLEWVLRQDYFEYSLPEGWRSYVKTRKMASTNTVKAK
jgi:glycosyltransferase involved in cell wall biosynthesis